MRGIMPPSGELPGPRDMPVVMDYGGHFNKLPAEQRPIKLLGPVQIVCRNFKPDNVSRSPSNLGFLRFLVRRHGGSPFE